MKYNKRTWLNSEGSPSTGSVVAFSGIVTTRDGKKVNNTFLEISDCKNKITIHQSMGDTKDDFIKKMELLKSEIEVFIKYLEK